MGTVHNLLNSGDKRMHDMNYYCEDFVVFNKISPKFQYKHNEVPTVLNVLAFVAQIMHPSGPHC